ncbi:hypothetical protein A6A19_05360 [Actinobacillus delphinicola]|uniref:Lipoprotein E n=1 Tax=Actinobacillus delphinicola TaxID=51161 RepID=A0A448TU34_9PAST|nr:5'-nucleotidase, lipoprotein e(P4) family [Actinobacillus delphinicola]MDG6897425.1 hypothetical protein [Actinobacillus delphinicola]VEJ09353.1 lipoprotein E [Actinobacillus delphinicola]
MKKKSLAAILLSTAVITLAGCSNSADINKLTPTDSKLAVMWMQNSGEFDALSYQAFNDAKMAFLKNKVRGKNAVIVDLDETMINNSKYAAWQVEHHQPYWSESWERWCEAREATAIPGAVDFAKFVVAHGGDIFYISNRSQKSYQATFDNLKALGFPQVDKQHLILRTNTSDKAARVKSVIDQGYHIALMVGDNLDDFGSDVYHKSNQERAAFVKAHKNNYGTKWIIIPNPTYGSFTRAKDLTLHPWNGK